MLHSSKAVIAELRRQSRPARDFDASRYFRGAADLGFYNIGTTGVRALARRIHDQHRDRWTIQDAMRLADALMEDRFLETKGVAIELVARYRRLFTPVMLPRWKRWLAKDRSANWATTDGICGSLIGPLLTAHPSLSRQLASWSRHPNLWVRRASIVALIPLARRGQALDLLYTNAGRLHHDPHDLIQKAVGWALREAGKADPRRLERYLRTNGAAIPRTTVRYAIERYAPSKRQELLRATKKIDIAAKSNASGEVSREDSGNGR
jgi:3-methyladenine DNA glycosylase AlkD